MGEPAAHRDPRQKTGAKVSLCQRYFGRMTLARFEKYILTACSPFSCTAQYSMCRMVVLDGEQRWKRQKASRTGASTQSPPPPPHPPTLLLVGSGAATGRNAPVMEDGCETSVPPGSCCTTPATPSRPLLVARTSRRAGVNGDDTIVHGHLWPSRRRPPPSLVLTTCAKPNHGCHRSGPPRLDGPVMQWPGTSRANLRALLPYM